MSSIHYCAAWTECGCFISCGHFHGSVGKAVVCIRGADAYVVAVDAGTMRSLTTAEEAQFQLAVHNSPGHNVVADAPAIAATKSIDSRYAVMTRIRAGDHWTWTTWMCFETCAEAAAHARRGDQVVRFRSAEWHALRRQTRDTPPGSDSCADNGLRLKAEEETLVEFVFRLLEACRFDLNCELGSETQQESITSEESRRHENAKRKRA